ncbi:cation-translocating P-type ATPase [Stomatohabitans albus]|uniref:heavy metal translocating P-type ATPase n=1 Tax=Stomatohabitans albus TaxID=3110766 RepID=UPI00300C99B0
MSASCCGKDEVTLVETTNSDTLSWFKDINVLIPIFSGVAFLSGMGIEWFAPSSMHTIAHVLFWIGLVLGAYTFVPNTLKLLFTKGFVGVGLLMTISAIGAIALGYVEEAAALVFLYSLSEALESKAMEKARSGLRELLKLVPETATRIQNGEAVEVDVKDLLVGDVIKVRPGERIATDGVILVGHSSVDTSAITGESIPVEVVPGDLVYAGSINASGVLEVEATNAGTDNSLTTIVDLIEQAQLEKGDRARLADRLARPLVPGIVAISALVAIIGTLVTGDMSLWVTRALVTLVAASPCALAISVPLTVVSAIGASSKFGVVIKSGAAFERFGDINHIALDKTGTLTRNIPTVTRLVLVRDADRAEVLGWAAALEAHSTHPLANAIVKAAPKVFEATNVEERAGEGVTGLVNGSMVTVGSPRWLDAAEAAKDVEALEAEGMTVVIVQRDGVTVGAIGVRDELRPEVPAVIAALKERGIGVTMLTGDNDRAAQALAAQAGIDDVRSELKPEDKAAAIAELNANISTAMVGDGINDAPALASADLGIAMGATGSDAAIETADVAFTGHDMRLLPLAIDHARRGRRIMIQNIVMSLAIIVILLPLSVFGVLGLAAVVFAHEFAEILVIMNGVRAGRVDKPEISAREFYVDTCALADDDHDHDHAHDQNDGHAHDQNHEESGSSTTPMTTAS